MKKVVFCEIAWMKYYSGVSEDDQPVNGGKYVIFLLIIVSIRVNFVHL